MSVRRKNAPLPKFDTLSIVTATRADGNMWVTAKDSDGTTVGESYASPCDGDYASIEMGRIVPWMHGKGLYPVLLTALRDHVQREGCKGLVSFGKGRVRTKSSESWEKFAAREARVRVQQRGDAAPDYVFSGLGAFAPSDFPKTIAQVNKHLRELGIPVTARSGGSYYYFLDDAGNPVTDASVFTYRASGQTFSAWVASARDAAKKAAEDNAVEAPKRIVLRRRLDGLGKLPKKGRIPLAVVKRAADKLPKWTRKCGFTIAQLREGMEVEREHRDVTKGGVEKTAQIAAAHLCEFKGGGYYPGLKKLEKRLKRSK